MAALSPTVFTDSSDPEPAWLDRHAYPFAAHYLRVRDGHLHYTDEGRGPALLFVHGTPAWSFEWRHLTRLLSPSYRCIALDHLGFGLSERPERADYTPEAHARRFAEFAGSLDLQHVTLVVHDYGGPIALPWALDNIERVRRLAVLNSWMWSFNDDPTTQKRARLAASSGVRFLYRWANASLRLLMPAAYGNRSKLTPDVHRQYLAPFEERDARVKVLWELARGLAASSTHFESLWHRRQTLQALPSTVIWGMKDRALTPDFLDRWRMALPNAQIVELATAGHWPQEEEPEAVAQALHALLRAV